MSTNLHRQWAPLREILGGAAVDEALRDAPDINHAPTDYCSGVWPDVASLYRRLIADARVAQVMAALERRGVAEVERDVLLRSISWLPRDHAASEQEPAEKARKRRSALRKRLAELADDLRDDPDLGGVWLSVNGTGFAQRFDDIPVGKQDEGVGGDVTSLAEMLAFFGDTLGTDDLANRPARTMALQSFVLRETFALLEAYFRNRAPNRQAEILASVVLATEIPPGTMTRLRKNERRRNYREPK